jgi:DNA-binding transcriptional MerR regulator
VKVSPPPQEHEVIGQMSIGEVARQSRLSPRALRIYDQLGLLAPAHVEAGSGYRYYVAGQLERARLIAALRQLEVPLADIGGIVLMEPAEAARRIEALWSRAEDEHAARRQLARLVVDRLNGRRSVVSEVFTREIPERSVLCVKRSVEGPEGAWAFGKEFIGILKERPLPRMEGRAGAMFSIYWGEVSDDSDGPVEWCKPVPDDQAEALASAYPELSLRREPAHREAYVKLGARGEPREPSAVELELASDSLRAWAEQQGLRPRDLVPLDDLGVRMTYLIEDSVDGEREPYCDFAVPFA